MSLAAEQVESTAGTLKGKITYHDITTLTVSGTIDASDIDFINNSLTSLKYLDLSSATITAYQGEKLANGRNYSADNTLPEFGLIGTRIETIILPKGLKCLSDGCLAASSITSITLPESVDSIGTGAFNGCSRLTEANLGHTQTTGLPMQIFKGCSSLTDIELPPHIKQISEEAFMGCSSLTGVHLPTGLQTIGDKAFNGCKTLTDINFTANLHTIGNEVFTGTALEAVDMTACKSLNHLGDRVFSHCSGLETVMMPESLTSLGDGVFFNCNNLTNIVIPATLTRLTPYMFKGTGISDAGQIVTEGIREIDDYALYGNANITEVTLPGSINRLGDKALSGMISLTVLDVTGIHDLPELGEDVFEGTAGEGVRLVTTVDMAPVFKTTPQWQDFDITADENSDTPTPDTIGSLKLRHDGNTLWINAPRAIDSITVSDLNGRVTAHAAVHGDTMAGISTATIPGGIAIVTVRFDNATCANIKIIL